MEAKEEHEELQQEAEQLEHLPKAGGQTERLSERPGGDVTVAKLQCEQLRAIFDHSCCLKMPGAWKAMSCTRCTMSHMSARQSSHRFSQSRKSRQAGNIRHELTKLFSNVRKASAS